MGWVEFAWKVFEIQRILTWLFKGEVDSQTFFTVLCSMHLHSCKNGIRIHIALVEYAFSGKIQNPFFAMLEGGHFVNVCQQAITAHLQKTGELVEYQRVNILHFPLSSVSINYLWFIFAAVRSRSSVNRRLLDVRICVQHKFIDQWLMLKELPLNISDKERNPSIVFYCSIYWS